MFHESEGYILETFLLGIIEIAAIVGGITIIWGIPLSIRYIVEIILFLMVPSISTIFLLGPTFGIIVLLLSTSLYSYIKTKSKYSLIDICLLFIGGIISDHLTQVITRFTSSKFQILYFITLFILYIYIYYLFRTHYSQQVNFTMFIMLLLMSLLTVISYYAYTYLLIESESSLYIALTVQIVYFICLVLLFYIVLKNVKKEHLIAQKTTELEQFAFYMAELEQVNRDMQKFRHDYNNILLSIQGYLQDNQIDELKDYFQKEILHTHKYPLSKSTLYNNLDNIHNRNIKGFLAAKILQAEERNIRIKVEIPEPIESFALDTIDLVRIIGIFLDNAIDQCEKEPLKEINLAVFKTLGASSIFVIQNPISNNTFTISEMYKKGISSKGIKRGIGLSTAKELVNNYTNCTLHTRIENDFFIQELEMLK